MSSSVGVTSPSIRTPKVPATKPRCIRRLGSDGVWVCLYGVSPPTTKWRWKLMEMALGFAMGQKVLNMGLCWGGLFDWHSEPICCNDFRTSNMNWNTFLGMKDAENSESRFCTRLLALKGGRLCAIRNVPPNRTHFAVQ